MRPRTRHTVLEAAIRVLGSSAALAARLGPEVQAQTVRAWRSRGRVPASYADQVATLALETPAREPTPLEVATSPELTALAQAARLEREAHAREAEEAAQARAAHAAALAAQHPLRRMPEALQDDARPLGPESVVWRDARARWVERVMGPGTEVQAGRGLALLAVASGAAPRQRTAIAHLAAGWSWRSGGTQVYAIEGDREPAEIAPGVAWVASWPSPLGTPESVSLTIGGTMATADQVEAAIAGRPGRPAWLDARPE